MAVPKGKVSKARRDKRRSSVWKLKVPGPTECVRSAVLTTAVRSRAPQRRTNSRSIRKAEANASAFAFFQNNSQAFLQFSRPDPLRLRKKLKNPETS